MDWPLHGAEKAKRVRGVLKGPLCHVELAFSFFPCFGFYLLLLVYCCLNVWLHTVRMQRLKRAETICGIQFSPFHLMGPRVISVLTSHLTSPAFNICRPVSAALALESHCPTRVQACSALSPGRWMDGRVWS